LQLKYTAKNDKIKVILLTAGFFFFQLSFSLNLTYNTFTLTVQIKIEEVTMCLRGAVAFVGNKRRKDESCFWSKVAAWVVAFWRVLVKLF